MTAEIRSIDKYDRVNWVTVVAMSIFHVGAVRSGQTRIVVATDEDEAKRIGARVLETNEGDLVASEVYDHVARAEDR